MAGGYTHVTLADRAHARLEQVEGLGGDEILAIGTLPSTCILGAVGPDYPYLAVAALGRKQGVWADRMHYENTADPLRHGVRRLRATPPSNNRFRALSWLFGYASHVATDLTIHPVVMRKVGPYQGNEAAHRICEMNQDVHIWKSRDLGGIPDAEYFTALYDQNTEAGKLHPAIAELWAGMLSHTYPDAAQDANLESWHTGFHRAITAVSNLPVFARHLLGGGGQAYPVKVDPQFVENLETPAGRMHFDAVCERAVDNILWMWSRIGRALAASTPAAAEQELAAIPAANLDTGLYLDQPDRLAMWGDR